MNLTEKIMAFETNLTVSNTEGVTIPGLVTKIANIVGVVAGALAFIYLLYSGILYVTANGNPDQAKKAQSGILNAIIGIVIIVLAYAIFSAVKNQAETLGRTS